MDRFKTLAAAVAVCGISTQLAWADIGPGPRPRPRPDLEAPAAKKPDGKVAEAKPTALKFVIDPKATTAKLVVPKKLLDQNAAAGKSSSNDSGTRTIIAGMAMSLAAVSLIFLPRLKRRWRIAAGVCLACLTTAIAIGTANGNAGPPLGYRREANVAGLKQSVSVEISQDGDEIKLVLPESYLTDLSKAWNTGGL